MKIISIEFSFVLLCFDWYLCCCFKKNTKPSTSYDWWKTIRYFCNTCMCDCSFPVPKCPYSSFSSIIMGNENSLSFLREILECTVWVLSTSKKQKQRNNTSVSFKQITVFACNYFFYRLDIMCRSVWIVTFRGASHKRAHGFLLLVVGWINFLMGGLIDWFGLTKKKDRLPYICVNVCPIVSSLVECHHDCRFWHKTKSATIITSTGFRIKVCILVLFHKTQRCQFTTPTTPMTKKGSISTFSASL